VDLEHGFDARDLQKWGIGCRQPVSKLIIQNEDFDFVAMDQGSPAFEGHCVVERALQVNRWKPVVVLTRCHHMGCHLEAMQVGALRYLEMPFSESGFVRLVESHVPSRVAVA